MLPSAAVAAVAMPLLVASQPFWADAPSCVQACISSAYASSAFPSPTAFCASTGGQAVTSCLSASCGASTSAVASTFSSLSSSLCSRYSSCVSAGSTGILTVTATAGAGGFENGPFEEGGGPFGGPFGWESQSKWPSNDATTTFTTTGCSWATQGWFGGGGWGDGDGSGGGIWGDGGFWGRSQTGWAYRTVTKTVTTTFTSVGNLVTATGIATVEMAVSGRQTSATTLFHAKATGSAGSQSGGVSTSSGSGPARPLGSGSGGNGKADGLAAVKIMALALGTLIAAIGML